MARQIDDRSYNLNGLWFFYYVERERHTHTHNPVNTRLISTISVSILMETFFIVNTEVIRRKQIQDLDRSILFT